VYADPQWRHRARAEMALGWSKVWDRTIVGYSPRHPELVGQDLASIAAGRDVDPFDVMVETGVDDDLDTRFVALVCNYDEEELGELFLDDRVVLGLGDAGAHANMLCDACYPSYLLSHWVRELAAISLPRAVWNLSGQPAQFLGLHDRGLVREGYAADLVAFDPATVRPRPMERAFDLPAGAERLLIRSEGIDYMWVNGMMVRASGSPIDGVSPGLLLRS
jgi:N-acyl-D-aspartate/D-glutamate deacylase